MCSNYRPVTRLDRLLSFFGIEREPAQPTPEEVWPLNLAPFIRRAEEGSGNKVIEDGIFGLLPHFAKELAYGRRTYNARSETVHELPSFSESWRSGRRCIIPAEAVYEPVTKPARRCVGASSSQAPCQWGLPASTDAGARPTENCCGAWPY